MDLAEYEIMYGVEDRHWWYVSLRAMIQRMMERHNGENKHRLLDVGCGTGANLACFGGNEAYGVDYSPVALTFCARRGLSRLMAASAASLPFEDDTFDVVLCMDVLAHQSMPDKRGPARELVRVLRPGGMLYLNVPAFQWLYSSHDEHVQTDHRFTRGEIAGLLTETGLEVLEAVYWNTLLFPAMAGIRLWRRICPPRAGSDLACGVTWWQNALFGGAAACERGLSACIKLPFGLSIMTAARKPGV